MKKTKRRWEVMLVAACVLLASAAAFASFPRVQSKPPQEASNSSGHTISCLSPLVLASGGLCCPGPRNSMSPCISSKPSMLNAAEKRLPPLVVHGVRIPLPVSLQLIKRGLQRSWSPKLADRNLLVCVFNKRPGTRVPLLHCDTNSEYFGGGVEDHSHLKSAAIKVHCYYNCFLTYENIIVALVRYVDNDESRAIILGSLLDKAPSASSTYSLRMPEVVPLWIPSQHVIANYPAYVTFVIGKGELADVQLVRRKKASITLKSDAKIRHQKRKENLGNPLPPGFICANTMIRC